MPWLPLAPRICETARGQARSMQAVAYCAHSQQVLVGLAVVGLHPLGPLQCAPAQAEGAELLTAMLWFWEMFCRLLTRNVKVSLPPTIAAHACSLSHQHAA